MVIETFEDIRSQEGTIELLVRWRGFKINESDWVGIDYMKADVPELLQE